MSINEYFFSSLKNIIENSFRNIHLYLEFNITHVTQQ